MATMKFYMTPGSCSTGLHIILEELEEVFEAYVVNLPAGDHLKADYVAINAKSTIPTLVRPDGVALTEVIAIAYWLATTRPRTGLWPADPDGGARALETMSYVVNVIHGQGFARIFSASAFCGEGAAPAAVKDIGRSIVERGFAIVDRALEGRACVAGAYSAADPILFYVAFWADKTGIPLPANLAAHYRLMLSRPAVQRVLREEGYDPARLGRDEERAGAA
jgi:glutathione S-transferase